MEFLRGILMLEISWVLKFLEISCEFRNFLPERYPEISSPPNYSANFFLLFCHLLFFKILALSRDISVLNF
jgi:hypothetical protein